MVGRNENKSTHLGEFHEDKKGFILSVLFTCFLICRNLYSVLKHFETGFGGKFNYNISSQHGKDCCSLTYTFSHTCISKVTVY
jgi:hypothetical protein